MNWKEETKKVVMAHQNQGKKMTYALPLEEPTTCYICGKYLFDKKSYMHEMDEAGFVMIFCTDICWMRFSG